MTSAHIAQSAAPFQAGAMVFDAADPDCRGKIIRPGIEVSEVRFDDGAEPFPTFTCAAPKRQSAWHHLKKGSTFEDWKQVGGQVEQDEGGKRRA